MPRRTHSTVHTTTIAGFCVLVAAAGLVPTVSAQSQRPPAAQGVQHPDPVPQRETLIRLSRPITVEFTDQRLGDIVTFLREYTTADIEPMWMDDRHATGLDPETRVTVSVRNSTVLQLIERVLDQARDTFSENTWQMSETGAIQIGPKERLNRYTRMVVYDINDLLLIIPDHYDVPRIDLNQALQQSGGRGGGGGGQSPFQDDQQDREAQRLERDERAREIADLIREIVETEQWIDNGGSAGRIRHFRGNLIVTAPDYMHRGIDGYPYWPAQATVTRNVDGRRYVTLTTDNSISKLSGLANEPVRAGAPGGGGTPSGPPGGGG